MKTRTIRLLTLLTVLVTWYAPATPIPMLDLPSLVDASDVIATGEVSTALVGRRTTMEIRGHVMSVDVMEAEMHVDRMIKGPASHVIRFQFLVPEFGMGYRGVTANSYRVVFLKRTQEVLEFASPYYPSFPAVPAHANQSGTPFDAVIGEIGAVLQSSTTSDDDKNVAIWALRTVRTAGATNALKIAVSSNANADVKLTAVAALVARGDNSVLSIAEQTLTDPQASIPDDIRQNLTSAIYEGIKSEKAIPTLTRFLKNSDVRVRRAAAMALRNTRSAKSIEPLVRALEDGDFQVRYYAVIGLAEITGQDDWRPLEEDFRADEGTYLAYWKTWALKSGR